ncbi:MAG: NUDIX hydrolase, partial [Candidatus Dojkabacteria bacterium]
MAQYEREVFKYCSKCNAELENVSDVKKVCNNCGYEYFTTPNPTSCGIILNKSFELLLIKRGHEPRKGLWDFPAGFVEVGESLEDGLVREMKEEVGLDIKNYNYFKS